jgi:hypothetical protein
VVHVSSITPMIGNEIMEPEGVAAGPILNMASVMGAQD